jgi:hypothetical protein
VPREILVAVVMKVIDTLVSLCAAVPTFLVVVAHAQTCPSENLILRASKLLINNDPWHLNRYFGSSIIN